MVELTSEEQNKVNRMKRTKDSLRDLGGNIKPTNIQIIGGPRRREKERVWENFWRDYSWKFLQHGRGNSQPSPRDTKIPIQGKTKERHANNTLIKLTKTKYKERILKAAREKKQVTYKENPYALQLIFQQKLCRPEGNGRIYLSTER